MPSRVFALMACESGMCFPDYKSLYLAPSDCKSDGTGGAERNERTDEEGAEEDVDANCGKRGYVVRSASAYSAASTRVLPAKYCPVLRRTGFPIWDSVCFPWLSFLVVSGRFGVRFGGFAIRRI